MRNRLLSISLMLFACITAMADAVGTWKLYPCYGNITEIAPSGKDVFVLASGNLYSCLYNSSGEATIRTYTKNDILNSNDIQHIAWVAASKKLIITYSDYTIDLLTLAGEVENISDFAEKETTDDKTINSIYVSGQYAYLATNLGIVKINTKDATIADTYKLGCKINYCYIEGSYLYAASEAEGLMRCQLTANLLNKNEWEKGIGAYTPKSNDTYVYDATNNCYWAADADSKLTKYTKQDDGSMVAETTGVKPDGPMYNEHNYVRYDNGRIITLRGMFEYGKDTTTPGFVQEYNTKTSSWTSYDNSYATTNNKNCIAHLQLDVDPRDKNHVMVASKSGLYSYTNGKMDAYYDKNTSDPILSVNNVTDYSIVTSVKYDTSGNLWIFNMGNTNVVCLTSSGEWKTFPQSILTTDDSRRIKSCFFDSRGLLWFVNETWKAPMCGFYDIQNNTMHIINEFVNEDGTTMSVSNIFTVTEDQNNNIWIGSLGGCFYLTSSDISTMQQTEGACDVTITQYKVSRNDGTNYADYLLNGIRIYDIKVDAANRKWFATADGIYLISSDNNTQLAHFTTDNSPIPSNYIKSIAIDNETGTVYFGTISGLCSYQSDVTNSIYGEMTKDNVYAYPNPVTPDFTGDITIVGLTSGSQIKILTTSGQLVNEGTCSGGSYTWDGCDGNGEKVASGIYMVNVATSEGKSGIVTKIAIVK